MMVHNKSSMINGIKMILKKNYSVETDLVDVKSLVDSGLSYGENYNKVFEYCEKRRLITKPIYSSI